MSLSANLSLPFIMPAQAQKHVTHNAAIEILDALVQLSLSDMDATEPPDEPGEGQIVAVGTGAKGAFAGREGDLACFYGGGWFFLTPRDGYRAWAEPEGTLFVYSGGLWRQFSGEGFGGEVDGVGINATWDAVNRLSLSAPATLLSHEGQGHRLTVNKAGEEDTASLLFQDGFSGRAEIGLAGTDDLSVKVSADGGSWTTAFSVESSTGRTTFDAIAANRIEGTAIQTSAQDRTPGRLMRADWGYGPGNVVGVVSENAGLPAGAVIERATNERGEYTRFADGTQICRVSDLILAHNSGFHLREVWNYPVPFIAPPTVFHTPDLSTASGYATSFGERTYWGPASSKPYVTNAIIDQFSTYGAPAIPTGASLRTSCFAVGSWF